MCFTLTHSIWPRCSGIRNAGFFTMSSCVFLASICLKDFSQRHTSIAAISMQRMANPIAIFVIVCDCWQRLDWCTTTVPDSRFSMANGQCPGSVDSHHLGFLSADLKYPENAIPRSREGLDCICSLVYKVGWFHQWSLGF